MLGNNFSKILLEERKKRQLTVKEFAELLNASPSTLFSWENGAIPRNYNQLRFISKKLQVPFYFLIFGEHENEYLRAC